MPQPNSARTVARCCLAASSVASFGAAQLERPVPYPLPRDRAWAAAVEAGTRTDTGVPGPNYWSNRASYAIEATLDPATAQVEGSIEAVYENRSPRSIDRLVLHLRHNAHKAGNLRNRYLEVTGGVTLGEVRVNGEVLPAAGGGRRRGRGRGPGASVRGTILTLRLAEALKPGDQATVATTWSYRVPKRGAPRNGHDDFHTYWLGYWYPQFAVFEDVSGWVADQYVTNAEFYMGYANYDLRLTVPKGFVVRATGTLQNPDDVLTKTARERLATARQSREIVHVITAEDIDNNRVTRMDHGDALTWHYRAEDVRDLAVSVCDRYLWDASHAVIEDRDGPGKDGVAMIHALYRPDQARSWRRAAEYARHTIEFMSDLVHPYQWPQMTACGGVIGGGMEFPMMTICGSGSLGLIGHELIHMWFPMLVGTNEKARAWQDEGFTSFFTAFASAAFQERKVDPRRSVQSYKRGAASGEAAPLMTHGDSYPGGGRGGYSFASYGKSSAILHQLRGLIGDELFFSTFKKYATDWAFKHPRAEDFFNAFDAATDQDLSWYFRTWYHETWTLDQAITSVETKGGKTVVVVTDEQFATYPTVVEATYENGKTETKQIDLAHWLSGNKTATVTFGAGVERVELNPGRVTLDLSARNDVWKRE